MKPPAPPKPKPKSAPTRKPPPFLPVSCEAVLSREQIATALAISTRTLDAMIASGEFPRRDTLVSKSPRWHVDTLNEWIRAKCAKE